MVGFRRTVQVISLLFFFYLIITTRPHIEGEFYRIESPIWPYLYFTTNPLTFISAAAASKSIPAVNYIPLIVMLALVLLLGRFFCGWICPLGVMIDAAAKVWKPPRHPQPSKWIPSPNVKFYILFAIVIVALFGVNIVGFFDPITIAMRGISFAVQPYLEWVVRAVIGPLWQVPVVSTVTEPVYGFLKKYYLTQQQPEYVMSILYLAILLGIFALSKIRRRFWCRYLCPLGAIHGLLGRFAIWRRRTGPACTECKLCGRMCRTEAIDLEDAALYDPRECIRCMDCRKICPVGAIEFTFWPSARDVRVESRQLQMTRRGLLTALGASFVALTFFRASAYSRNARVKLLRPPGAKDEDEFLKRCIRCGECMRACPQHALQPALLQFGLEKMWTPVVTPRIGYCEYNCTICTQVCPTGALEPLSQAVKRQFRIGTAFFDKNRCIPWAENIDCLVCEEVCPTPTKSILLRDEEVLDDEGNKRIVKRPYLVEEYCIGCGICENKCPVEGEAAIIVVPRYETRHGGLAVGTAYVGTSGPYGATEPTTKEGGASGKQSEEKGAEPYSSSSDPYR